MNPKQLYELANDLFSKRSGLIGLWQEIAENFYPERADFTGQRYLGTDFAANLTTSYPILVRRDLGNAISAILRPASKPWFYAGVGEEDEKLDRDGEAWLQNATTVKRRAMYDRRSQFTRATSEGDHDYSTFGQCVLSVELNRRRDGLLYRNWHLRDVAWQEGAEGSIDTIFRRWKPMLRELSALFGGHLHEKMRKRLEKEPFERVDVMHMVVARDLFDSATRAPWVSVYYDPENQHVIEETGLMTPYYIIPRWQTVSGSQYAFSPATVAGLPDGRLIQSMSYTLLEAGEKHVNPPMVAVQEALRSDIAIYAGGVTWADSAYDERLGEVLRPLTQDRGGMQLGLEMIQDTRAMLMEAFFLNKLNLPQRAPEMTAYEVGQRIQQYIREALPLFAPMEMDYNGQICDATFSLMFRAGAFGSPMDLPPSLQGREVQFRFESPLHEAIEREKGNSFIEAQQFVMAAAQLDPAAAAIVDARIALRDVLKGLRVPAEWTRTEREVAQISQTQQQAQGAMAALEMAGKQAEVQKTSAEAAQAKAEALAASAA